MILSWGIVGEDDLKKLYPENTEVPSKRRGRELIHFMFLHKSCFIAVSHPEVRLIINF